MDHHLIKNPTTTTNPCFFAKQLTYIESDQFQLNREHISTCQDCRNKIGTYENYRQDFSEYFDSFKATTEISKALSDELNEIIDVPVTTSIRDNSFSPRVKYRFSIKDFMLFLIFGVSRRVQLVTLILIGLAASIYW